jgi:hypothetical protein
LDSNPDASLLAFGSDAGEFILLSRLDDTIETVFEGDVNDVVQKLIDAIEIGDCTLLVGGEQFINLYGSCGIEVAVDIKPQSCPNPLNVRSNGVLPVAILGSEDLDVTTINVDTLLLEGVVAPIRSNFEDVAAPVIDGEECECTTEGPDGYLDLTLKFKTQAIVAALGEVVNGEKLALTLTGELSDGTPIEGADCIRIKKPRAKRAKKVK